MQPMTPAVYAQISGDTMPIPHAKVSQSSYYAPFGAFEDLFSQESGKHPSFPWYIHFSRDLVADETGHASSKTMFGRVYISADANGFLQRSEELALRDGETGIVTLKLERTGAIVGKVRDDSGNPLPGAVVNISGRTVYDERDQAPRCEVYASDISGYDGTYVITSGIDPGCEYRIEASIPSYAYYSKWYLNPFLHQQLGEADDREEIYEMTVLQFKDPYRQDERYPSLLFNSTTIERVKVQQGKLTVVDIILQSVPAGKERSGSISGRVIDVSGDPIADALVEARANEENAQGMTDRNGLFSINKVKAGNYTITVQPPDHRLVVRQAPNIIVEEGQHVEIGDIVGERSASISGRVMLSDRTPLPGLFAAIRPIELDERYDNYYPCENCIVTYIPDALDQRGTDSQGRYFMSKNLPPGTYNISVNNHELKLGDRTIRLEPSTLTVDVRETKEVADADLVFNYTVIQDLADFKDASIRFSGFVKDEQENPVSGVGITARTFVPRYGSIEQQTLTDENGFYSMYVLKRDLPDNTDGLKWTLYVDPTLYSSSYNIYYEDIIDKDFAIYNYSQGQQDVVTNWGDQKRLDYVVQKFTADDILRSDIEVVVKGEAAKYRLPSKQFVLTSGYGDDEDIHLTTNSTLVGSWLDTKNNSIIVEIDLIAGTFGQTDIVIPKKIATGISTALFDGQQGMDDSTNRRDVRTMENATHTTVSLTYAEDFERIELQAARVVPEFGSQLLFLAIGLAIIGIVANSIFFRREEMLHER